MQQSYWERRGIPQLKPTIPYGNIKEIGRSTQISLLIRDFYNQTKDKYPYFGVYFFQRPVLIVNDSNVIKNVLIKDFKHFQDRGIFYNERDDKLSAHLFSLNFDKWKILRNKISPTFSSGKMKFMFPTMLDVGQSLQQYMSVQTIDGQCVLEMKDILARYTTDVIGKCAFGIECNSLTNPDAEFWRMGKRTFETPRHKPIITFLIGSFKRFAVMIRTKVIRDDVSDFFLSIVHETVHHRKANAIRRNDFMDILINLTNQAEGSLTIDEIAANAFVFFLAGFETSATSMTFVLYELARNMDIQRKAQGIRKNPPVGVLIRKTTEDYHIQETNHTVPKDSTVIIPVLGIHRDKRYYPNPEKFDPERFSAENKAENDRMFFGFGEGPRNCIGYRFGMVQTRIGLISLLSKFEFTSCSRTMEELKYSLRNVILSPEGGMWLKVSKIKPNRAE
ncbi:hypothetical protein HA402_004427 [Bradysia odoriphaga]|nr:hypothetical protein HA402_004427 [Bradysia odoriphaga]